MVRSEKDWVESLIDAKLKAMLDDLYRVIYETQCNHATPAEVITAVAYAVEAARRAHPTAGGT